jgi:ABC-type protease/lipase transport system fused ATPase/permease subunit
VGFYAPGKTFVLYYGEQSYYDGIVILGHLDGAVAQDIATLDGSIAANISTLDDEAR